MDTSNTNPRNKKGRAARRRRQKLLAISRAEEELLNQRQRQQQESPSTRSSQSAVATATDVTATILKEEKNTILPSDRNKLRAPVIETRDRLGWLPRDETLLVKQLGFVPGNAVRICCRWNNLPDRLQRCLPETKSNNNHNDDPVVVQLYPVATRDVFAGGKSDGRKFKSRKRRKINPTNESVTTTDVSAEDKEDDSTVVLEPFPTLYWLTHPLLKIWVSKLEVNGFGVELEKRLGRDTVALNRMKRAHHAYGQSRVQLLTPNDQTEIQARRWNAALEEARGVAGIRNYAAVKCLHAHLAHYLSSDAGSQDNIVGAWVVDAICEMEAPNGSSGGNEKSR